MVSETLSKGSLIGLAMVSVSSGINVIVSNIDNGYKGLISGSFLVLVGFGFIMWREYLKAKYQKNKNKK